MVTSDVQQKIYVPLDDEVVDNMLIEADYQRKWTAPYWCVSDPTFKPTDYWFFFSGNKPVTKENVKKGYPEVDHTIPFPINFYKFKKIVWTTVNGIYGEYMVYKKVGEGIRYFGLRA